MTQVRWPNGKAFAFTVFDDPDAQTVAEGREVYAFLRDLGFRTTKGIWPIWGNQPRSDNGGSCDDADYRAWCLELVAEGFEMGYHNATQYTSVREETRRGLDRYAEIFGHDPVTMSNHYNCEEDIYWGDARMSGWRRLVYNVLTRGKLRNHFFGEVEGHPLFWGDLCRERIEYVRNFVFMDINTTRACPLMPYHDPARPLVRQWYASAEGADVHKYNRTLAEANIDRLAEQGGGCIMYTHFGKGFVQDGKLNPRFRELMTRLARLDGWFAPVADVLGHIRRERGEHVLTDAERAELERRWLWEKARHGSS